MNRPTIKSGRFSAGADFRCGENVVIDVADDVILGDRVVLGDNTYLCGRSVKIGDDFFGYSHWGKRLEVGLGRRSEEDAILTVGCRCTLHDNKIDLARRVIIGHDVGLSPEVTIYTHGYWMSCLEGFPCRFAPVQIDNGVIVGYRSTILPGVCVEHYAVIGAGSVVTKNVYTRQIWAGNPAQFVRNVERPVSDGEKNELVDEILSDYIQSCTYRGIHTEGFDLLSQGTVEIYGCRFHLWSCQIVGKEDERTDDFRWHLFTRGIRIYTKRPFTKLEKR